MRSRFAFGALTALILALLAVFVALFLHRDQRVGLGGEIVYDDFGFGVVESRELASLGEPPLAPRGVFRLVRLRVANHAKRVDYHLADHRAVLVDEAGKRHEVDPIATRALHAPAPPPAIGPGEEALTDLVFDVPARARELRLEISWGSGAIDALDHLVFGTRTVELDRLR